MSALRQVDEVPAERFIKAMKALSDGELLALVQPMVDIQGMVDNGTLVSPTRPPLTSIMSNEKCIEFMEALGHWCFAELHYRDRVLEELEDE